MRSSYLEGWLYVPLEVLGPERAMAFRRTLTIRPRKFGDEPVHPIPMYDASRPGYLGVPVDWGIRNLPGLEYEDRSVMGGELVAHTRPDPSHPRAAPGQAKFMADCLAAAQDNLAALAVAPTGTGKTVTALNTAAELGRRTIVMTPLEKLCDQWVEEAHTHLGIPYSRIGWVQQDRCNYDGKDIVIGLMHSLAMRRYPDPFYRAFGTAIWDEVDVCGAPMFAATLGLFPATYRLAFTATPTRKDKTENTFLYYFGTPAVVAEAQALPMTCHVLDYRSRGLPWSKTRGGIIKWLSLDRQRNELLVAVIRKLYRNGRNVLVIGEKIDHLQALMDLCIQAGIPDAEIGQFTGEATSVVTEVDGSKKVKRRKRAKITDEYLDWVKAHARVVFATYGMMRRGIDIPRFDAGMDVTPISQAIQVTGRIRRPLPGKPRPLWYTVRDINVSAALNWYKGRLKDYRTSNVEVVEWGDIR